MQQDERDHYLGRLFGADACIKSEIFFQEQVAEPLNELLGVLCGLAKKKPWLRQECGWLLFKCVSSLPGSANWVTENILASLVAHNLICTPEGVAIWLAAKQKFPEISFPKDIWKHDNPLYKKEKSLLAKVMRDATPKNEDDPKDQQAQGTAIWKPQLHFAWETVLEHLYSNIDEAGESINSKLVPFEQFWTEVVDGEHDIILRNDHN